MYKENNELYEFGEFRLDIGEHSLVRLDGTIPGQLPGKAFQTLCILVRDSGHLISKKDLIDQIWPDSFVEENNLDKCIHAIRHVLGDSSSEKKYIETVRKQGYRFVADVRTIPIDTSSRNGKPAIGHFSAAGPSRSAADPERSAFRILRPAVYVGSAIAVITLLVAIAYFGSSLNAPAARAGRGTSRDDAYRFYLDGVNHLGRAALPSEQEAIENLEESIRLDPLFAAAHAALARGRVEMSSLVEDPAQDCSKAGASVEKALELNPSLAPAHESAGLLKFKCEWNFAAAEPEFVRVLDLDPKSDSAHASFAAYLNSVGRSDRSIAEIERAIEINPNSPAHRIQQGIILFFARRNAEALAAFERAGQLAPLGLAHGWVWTACLANGDEDGAFEWFIKYETERKQIKPDPERIEMIRTLYASSGWKGIREMQLNAEVQNPVYAKGKYYRLARLSTQLGRTDDAFKYLERAFDRRDAQLLLLKYEPVFEPLRGDSRYDHLIQRLGFPRE